METETLFTATKWEILKLLEQGPRAPIEIAEAIGSSLANVSQQLKLLELAGIVTSSRVGNRDKGQPRVLYRMAGNLSYLIATTGDFVEKKAVQLSERNKAVLRIWFLEDARLREALEKAMWALDGKLADITRITYSGMESGTPVLEVAGKAKVPAAVDVGGEIGKVIVRHDADPQGYILYQVA